MILHIGMPKCGSTFLQRVLLKNQKLLYQRGIAYPHSGNGHPGNGRNCEKLSPESLDAHFGTSTTLFLSFEGLFGAARRARPLSEAIEKLNVGVEIWVFLRPFNEIALGCYSQELKQNFFEFLETRNPFGGLSFEKYAEKLAQRLAPAERILEWQAAIPRAKIKLANHFEIKNQITTKFDAGNLDWAIPMRQVNRSLRKTDCDHLIDLLTDPQISNPLIIEARKNAFQNAGMPDPGRTQKLVGTIEAFFEEQNKRLSHHFDFDNRPRS